MCLCVCIYICILYININKKFIEQEYIVTIIKQVKKITIDIIICE